MTTTVTIKTYDWPTEIIYTDQLGSGHPRDTEETTEVVAIHSERQFHITQSRSITSIRELEKPE